MLLNVINKSKIYIIFMLFFVFYGCKTISNNIENRDIPVDIYVCDRDGYWKNGNRIEFPFKKFDLHLSSFVVSGKDIYAGGTITTSHYEAGYEKACLLKNGKKVPLTYLCSDEHSSQSGKITCDSEVYSIAIYGNDIYAGGENITCSGLVRAGYWKNGKWIGLKPVDSKKNSSVYSIAIYNGDIYAAGSCRIDSEISIPGYWKNGEWIRLYPPDDLVKKSGTGEIVIHNGDIYVVGYCKYSSEIRIPGYWKNGKWIKLDNNSKLAISLFIYGDDIYVGGYSGNWWEKMRAGYWKNSKWVELKTPDPEGNSKASSIVVHNGDIYVAGCYKINKSSYIPCYWKNGELVTLDYDAESDAKVISIIVVDKEQD